jgi:hypothetical protein
VEAAAVTASEGERMVHLPHRGKLRREVKEEAVDADDADLSAGAGAEASPFHKRSRLAQQQQPPPPQVGFPVASLIRSPFFG